MSLVLTASGCAMAPGPYLGVTRSNVYDPDRADASDAALEQNVSERADIHTISAASIAQMVTARNLAEGRDARERAQAAAQPAPNGYTYRVGPQDILTVTVWNHPELNNPAAMSNLASGRVVGEDGSFFFPYAGKVQAAGRTVDEIRASLTATLAKVLVEPQVDVAVIDYRSKRVYVMGMVDKPGVESVSDVPLTVTGALAAAGGLKPEADLYGATLTRKGATQPLNLYALYYEGDVGQNLQLQAGDILTVPENRYNKIFVMGEVGKQQSVLMPRGRVSLTEAISDAGGFNPISSNTGQVYVIRQGRNDRPQIWHLDASSPDALVLADQFDLHPRDIVYVDPAKVTRFGRVLTNILPTAGLLRQTLQY
jgi:polysaccharide export outer membrane protein